MELEELLELLDQFSQFGRFAYSGVSAGLSVVLAITAILCLIQCFFGFKLFKLMTVLVGAFIGLIVGLLGASFSSFSGSNALTFVFVILLIVLPIIFGFLAYKVYLIGVFIYAGFIPGIITAILCQTSVAFLIGFIIFGILGVILARPYLIFITAVPSGLLAGMSIMLLFSVPNLGIGVFIGLLLSIAGFVFQWKTTKNTPNTNSDSKPKFSVGIKYIKCNTAYIAAILLFAQSILVLFIHLPILTWLAALVFSAGCIIKIPNDSNGKRLNCKQYMTPEDAKSIYVFEKPRTAYILIGIVLFAIYLLFNNYVYHLYNQLVFRLANFICNVIRSLSLCFIFGSFMYKIEGSASPENKVDELGDVSSGPSEPITQSTSATPVPSVPAAKTTVLNKPKELPSVLNHKPDVNFDKLISNIKTIIDTKLPKSLNDFKLKDYQISFSAPNVPFLIGGLALVLVGTVCNFSILNILGLIFVVLSFVKKSSDS